MPSWGDGRDGIRVNPRRKPTKLRLERLEERAMLALVPELVRDINFTVGPNEDSFPNNFVDVGGIAFFTARDAQNGSELWKSDGTSAGTVLVRDIYPGVDGADPRFLMNFNGTLYFQANGGACGYELWKSDGTSAGTVLLRDIQLGNGGSFPNSLTLVNGAIYFAANDGMNGSELWKSDVRWTPFFVPPNGLHL